MAANKAVADALAGLKPGEVFQQFPVSGVLVLATESRMQALLGCRRPRDARGWDGGVSEQCLSSGVVGVPGSAKSMLP